MKICTKRLPVTCAFVFSLFSCQKITTYHQVEYGGDSEKIERSEFFEYFQKEHDNRNTFSSFRTIVTREDGQPLDSGTKRTINRDLDRLAILGSISYDSPQWCPYFYYYSLDFGKISDGFTYGNPPLEAFVRSISNVALLYRGSFSGNAVFYRYKVEIFDYGTLYFSKDYYLKSVEYSGDDGMVYNLDFSYFNSNDIPKNAGNNIDGETFLTTLIAKGNHLKPGEAQCARYTCEGTFCFEVERDGEAVVERHENIHFELLRDYSFRGTELEWHSPLLERSINSVTCKTVHETLVLDDASEEFKNEFLDYVRRDISQYFDYSSSSAVGMSMTPCGLRNQRLQEYSASYSLFPLSSNIVYYPGNSSWSFEFNEEGLVKKYQLERNYGSDYYVCYSISAEYYSGPSYNLMQSLSS